jgi:hypothetical protein
MSRSESLFRNWKVVIREDIVMKLLMRETTPPAHTVYVKGDDVASFTNGRGTSDEKAYRCDISRL